MTFVTPWWMVLAPADAPYKRPGRDGWWVVINKKTTGPYRTKQEAEEAKESFVSNS